MTDQKKGWHVAIDGMDGAGKDTLLNFLADLERKAGRSVLNIQDFESTANQYFVPDNSHDTLIVSEPTYCQIGSLLRKQLVTTKGRPVSTAIAAECFSADRHLLQVTTVQPALKMGKTILQGRCVSASLVYQPIQADEQGEELHELTIAKIPGNKFSLEHAPDLLIILTLRPEAGQERLESRMKNDHTFYDNATFQQKVFKRYTEEFLSKYFGATAIEFVDSSGTLGETKQQIEAIYNKYCPYKV